MWPKLAFIGLIIVRLMVSGNPDAKRLYDDLLSSYNKLVRPVVNTSDVLRVSIKLKLSQLIDVVSNPSDTMVHDYTNIFK
jgi:nicotinic acetylcholine receptor